jgi:hypothetical protein
VLKRAFLDERERFFFSFFFFFVSSFLVLLFRKPAIFLFANAQRGVLIRVLSVAGRKKKIMLRKSKKEAPPNADALAQKYQQWKQFFTFHDKDNSGELEPHEFKGLHEGLLKNNIPVKADALEVFYEIDKDKSGTISFWEFTMYLEKLRAQKAN